MNNKIDIWLSDGIYALFEQEASKLGLTVNQYVLHVLRFLAVRLLAEGK